MIHILWAFIVFLFSIVGYRIGRENGIKAALKIINSEVQDETTKRR